ncbi:RUN domain-containing protein 1 isoform X2 [Teleopsis dalmanni]|uniref:RUN domain-containing protein 1 isoform X2 n=1 Tax=Teleopsis dalmanni TaxID=139649 RepID=UPI0018CCD9EE|nr:RUN domain-containing protein 1 isoform X2 [Teleopsis dalmanni]
MNRTICENTDIKFDKTYDFIEKCDECKSQQFIGKVNNNMCNNNSTLKKNFPFCEFMPKQNPSTLMRQEHLSKITKTGVCVDIQPVNHDISQPLRQRWSPVGANCDDTVIPISDLPKSESEMKPLNSNQEKEDVLHSEHIEISRLRYLEEEQETLTSSLMALTSHIAHLQLRVRQIVEAPSDERDQLLKDLEKFAFKGIPEPISADVLTSDDSQYSGLFIQPTNKEDEIIFDRQFKLISQLKLQLSQLEKFAYDSGAPVLPQDVLLEKQRIIIDELKNKLNLKVEQQDLPELSSDELKCQVESALGEFIGPLKMKEQLVNQLKTQIIDLERFIAYLQCDSDDLKLKTFSNNGKQSGAYNSYAAKKKIILAPTKNSIEQIRPEVNDTKNFEHLKADISNNTQRNEPESFREKAYNLVDKASLLMQMFTTTHFDPTAHRFQKNILKKTNKASHWGDLRAQLEIDIQKISFLASTLTLDRKTLTNTMRPEKITTKLSKTTRHKTLTAIPFKQTRNCKLRIESSEIKACHISSVLTEDINECYDWEGNGCMITHSLNPKDDLISTVSRELSDAVRKNFAMTLMRLIQHGLRVGSESATSSVMMPLMRCLNPFPMTTSEHNLSTRRSHNSVITASSDEGSVAYGNKNINTNKSSSNFLSNGVYRQMHAWELILEYYYMKRGDEYNNTPARKLSDSFNLDIGDSRAVSVKQSLLMVIGMIISVHRPYKRSLNAHFKAFVCAGLNCLRPTRRILLILKKLEMPTKLLPVLTSIKSYIPVLIKDG